MQVAILLWPKPWNFQNSWAAEQANLFGRIFSIQRRWPKNLVKRRIASIAATVQQWHPTVQFVTTKFSSMLSNLGEIPKYKIHWNEFALIAKSRQQAILNLLPNSHSMRLQFIILKKSSQCTGRNYWLNLKISSNNPMMKATSLKISLINKSKLRHLKISVQKIFLNGTNILLQIDFCLKQIDLFYLINFKSKYLFNWAQV